MHLQGNAVKTICEQLNRTRQWLYKWLQRYNQSSGSAWYKNESCAPKSIPSKTAASLEQTIVEVRRRLSAQPYAQKGAISVLYELARLGVNPPSMATINRILQRHQLVGTSEVKRLRSTEYPKHFMGIQQMDLIGPRYLKGGGRFYFYTIIDAETHFAGVYPIANKSAESIVPCLADYWHSYQMPDFLQMDNELSFRGSNRHPRGLGLLMRAAISNGVTPIFIPPAEPWRNGIVERFNSTVQKHFYDAQTFTSLDDLREKAKEFTVFHNENHRYASQGNRTPNQLVGEMLHKHTLPKEMSLTQKIFLENGRMIFIRFIRGDLKLHLLNETFTVKPALKYAYVVAEVMLEKYVLVVSQNNTVHHVFPFAMSLP